jgi:hypothetical protein
MTTRHSTSNMQSVLNRLTVFISFAFLTFGFCAARAQNAQNAAQSMRFFVTSVGSGKGGDLGGLAGADAHCQSLAAAGAPAYSAADAKGGTTKSGLGQIRRYGLPSASGRPRPRSAA